MSGRRGRNSLPVRRRTSPPTTISISSDGDECASTPSDGASSFAGPVPSGRPTPLHEDRRATTTNSPGSGTEQPSKKVKVEEIDLTQESSDESDEEQEDERDGEGEIDMEEADQDDEESAGDEEEDPEDEDYTDRPAQRSRHRRTARPNVNTPSTDEGAQRRSSHSSQAPPPSHPHMSGPHHQPRSARAPSHRERSRSPLKFRNLAATHPGSPPPRDHYQASYQDHRQEYEEDEEARAPHQSRHQGDGDNATQAQGTSSRESQPQAFEDRAQSPHPAPATDDPSQQQQHAQRIVTLTRANQTLKRQHDRMVLQNSRQHLQLRTELDAVKAANEKLVSKGLVDARQRRAAEAELVTVKASLTKSQMTMGTLRTMVQELKRQVEDKEDERQSTQDEQRQRRAETQQQQQAREQQQQQQAREQLQQQQQAREQLQKQQQQAREQQQRQQAEQAQARATAAANLAAQFAQQQQQHANQARQHEYMRRQAASGASFAAGYAARNAQWSAPQDYSHPAGFSQQYGSYEHTGPQHSPRPVPRPAPPPVPTPQPQHSAAAAFATATPPVLDATTRVHDLKLYLKQAGATEAMTRIHEKDELLALALTKANAWEIRRLVACSVVAHDPGFNTAAQAQAFAYAAALRVPKDTLSLSPEGQAIVQAAYKDLRIRVHPDKNPGDHATATSAFQFLQQANNALSR